MFVRELMIVEQKVWHREVLRFLNIQNLVGARRLSENSATQEIRFFGTALGLAARVTVDSVTC